MIQHLNVLRRVSIFALTISLIIGGIGDAQDAKSLPIDELKVAASQGDISAQIELADRYLEGRGVAKEAQRAFALLLKAAQAGDAKAQYLLGRCYSKGEGTNKDDVVANDWFLKAANQGYLPGELEMVLTYRDGRGVPVDHEKGFFWAKKAAQNGDDSAADQVGLYYIQGNGVQQDLKKGFTYSLKGAGSQAHAAYDVGLCYLGGYYVAKDPVQALFWFRVAAKLGKGEQANEYIELLEKSLTPTQLKEAALLVENFPARQKGLIQTSALSLKSPNGVDVKISYDFRSGLMIVPLTINGKTADFIVDTGASSLVIEPSLAEACGLKRNDYMPAAGFGGELELGEIADVAEIKMGNLSIRNARAIVLPSDFKSLVGHQFGGIVGVDIFQKAVLKFNFVAQTIDIHTAEGFSKPEDDSQVLPLQEGQLTPRVEGYLTCGAIKSATDFFMVDTGSTGSIIVGQDFQSRNPLLKLRDEQQSSARGVGGQLQGVSGYCSLFGLGQLQVPNPEVNFLRGTISSTGQTAAGTAGMQIWKRFDLTIDFRARCLYLRKNAWFNLPFSRATEAKGSGALPDSKATDR